MNRKSIARRSRGMLASPVVQGLLIGACATEALDWLSTLLYENEDDETRRAEDHARRGRHAYEVAIDRFARAAGKELNGDEIAKWGWRFHKTFGILGGLGYAALRRKNRRMGWGYGLGFGAAFFLV